MNNWKIYAVLSYASGLALSDSLKKWVLLVRFLNVSAFGPKYVNRVGHSYFSYGLGYQVSGPWCHLRVLLDRPVNLGLVSDTWSKYGGYAHLHVIRSHNDLERYFGEYLAKSQQVYYFHSLASLEPEKLPIWWLSLSRQFSEGV